MATRKRSLSPDQQGRYRPCIGWRIDDDGKRRQPRFNLGTDQREAERRYNRIQDLYADDCRASGRDHWSPYGLRFADILAQGASTIGFDPPSLTDARASIEYQQAVEQNRHWFPSLNIVPTNLAAYGKSAQDNKELVRRHLAELIVEMKRAGALSSTDVIPEKLVEGTFHEALDAYAAEIRRDSPKVGDGVLNQTGRKRIERVVRIKGRHEDFPLFELTKGKITELIAYWRNRPQTKRDTVMAYDTARIHLEEFDRFLNWLDDCEKFGWVMPKGVKKISRKIVQLDSEKKLSAIVKETYSPDQLKTINKQAVELERLTLYLGLNCAMGAAELGRLVIEDFLLNTPHPLAKKLGLKSSMADSWLRCLRPKTTVFGEWFLWPETVEIVKWGVTRAKRIGSELIFCLDDGSPMFDEALAKPDCRFANLWKDAYDRASPGSDKLPWLPIGSLRDTLPDYLWREHDSELASMCVAHGSPSPDKLMECYANRPYGRFHRAVKKAWKFFCPVFDLSDSKNRKAKAG